MSKRFVFALCLSLLTGAGLGLVAQAQPQAVKHARGRVAPANLAHLKESKKRLALPPATTLTAYDARKDNLVGPVKNQGQCGSCWDFSGTGVVEVAFAKAGLGPVVFSEQYTLSCCRNGGCNGDDNTTVLQWAKGHGLPKSSDYGPYQAREGSCKYTSSMPLLEITDWGFADGGQGNGVTDTQLIKNAIVAFGCVGSAVAAGGGQWDDAGPGTTLTGTSHNIDHDVILVGFDDAHDNGDGSKGGWIMRNSWGTDWADNGYVWMKYGAYDIGTEAVYAFVNNPNPPTPPTPPVPPVPPTPPTPPAPGGYSWLGWIVAAVALLVAGVAVLVRKPVTFLK